MRLTLLLLLATASSTLAGNESFRAHLNADPSRQGFQVQGADDGRFAWSQGGPLVVTLDSNADAARAQALLPFTLDGTTSFTLSMDFRIDSLSGSPDDFFQLSFGLVNSETTGLNRTGTSLPAPPFFIDDSDCHDFVELAYFPNVTSFGGPFLQPSVFGGGAGSAFANFAANFGPSSDLGDNGPGLVRELPAALPLRVVMTYDACAQSLLTRVFALDRGKASELATGIEPLDVSFVNLVSTFRVDAFAINAFRDLADFDPSTRSLEGVVSFDTVGVVKHEPLSAKLRPSERAAGSNGNAPLVVVGWPDAPASGETVDVTLSVDDGAGTTLTLPARGQGEARAVLHAPSDVIGTHDLVLHLGTCDVAVTR